MFRRLSFLTVLVLMGALFLSLVPAAHAQRGGFSGGGFGRGGFGRGGIGRGGIGGAHAPGHSAPASVNVFQAGSSFFNNFGRSHITPFTGKAVTRFPGVFVHSAPFGFILTDGFVGVPHFDSSLGFAIPPLVTTAPNVFFFGVRIGPRAVFRRPVFQSVVDLGTISPITAVSIDSTRKSNATIINLPANAFRGGRQ